MLYQIRPVPRFHFANPVKSARVNRGLTPVDWAGQTLEDYSLTVEPVGTTSPARAEAGLANVTRMVVDRPVRRLTIESCARVSVDRLVPVPEVGDPTLADIARMARARGSSAT